MPSETHVDEDVVCKRCEARSRTGYPIPTGQHCSEERHGQTVTVEHDWVPVDQAHEYDIEVNTA